MTDSTSQTHAGLRAGCSAHLAAGCRGGRRLAVINLQLLRRHVVTGGGTTRWSGLRRGARGGGAGLAAWRRGLRELHRAGQPGGGWCGAIYTEGMRRAFR